MRIVVAGGPRTGKTTLAEKMCKEHGGIAVFHTDDLMDHPWEEVSDQVSTWFDRPGSWIVEGVRAVHAVRKWMASHHEGLPCDRLVFLTHPKAEPSKGQAAMSKAQQTVLLDIEGPLRLRGLGVERHIHLRQDAFSSASDYDTKILVEKVAYTKEGLVRAHHKGKTILIPITSIAVIEEIPGVKKC